LEGGKSLKGCGVWDIGLVIFVVEQYLQCGGGVKKVYKLRCAQQVAGRFARAELIAGSL